MTIVDKENNIAKQEQGKHIFLLGYMGSGKSSIGIRLAQKLGVRYIDTDDLIEAGEGMSITEIFSKRGEEYFRDLEQKTLLELKAYPPSIISTGGGMPCYNDGVSLMNDMGITVYLEASVDELVNRLWSERDKRPLISNLKDESELFGFISKHLSERNSFYLKASYKVDADLEPDKLIKELMLIPGLSENKDSGH